MTLTEGHFGNSARFDGPSSRFLPPKRARIEIARHAQSTQNGDRVTWNSEAGYVSGTIIKIQARDVEYKG